MTRYCSKCGARNEIQSDSLEAQCHKCGESMTAGGGGTPSPTPTPTPPPSPSPSPTPRTSIPSTSYPTGTEMDEFIKVYEWFERNNKRHN